MTAYKMTFRATRPERRGGPVVEVRRTRTVFAEDYAEAVDKATVLARAFLKGTELDWDVDVPCPPEEVRP